MPRSSTPPRPRDMTLAEIIEAGIGDRLDHAGIALSRVTAEDVVAVAGAWFVETALTAVHHVELRLGRPLGRAVGRVLEAVA